MNKYGARSYTFRRWANVLGGLFLTIFGEIYFFNVSAQTKPAEAFKSPAEQNLLNGRLLFTSTTFYFQNFPPSVSGYIGISNADGSGLS